MKHTVRPPAGHHRSAPARTVIAAGLAVTALAAGCSTTQEPSGPPPSGITAAPSSRTASPSGPAPGSPSTGSSPMSPRTPSSTAPPTSSSRPPAPAPSPGGSPSPSTFPVALRGQDVERIPTSRHLVALTFDAGANADGLGSILGTLAREHVRATFFLTGRWVTDDPDRVRRIRTGGHRVGNHTQTHPDLTALGDAAVRTQVLTAQRTITGAGADPRPLFRFPFGERTDHSIRLVNDLGYVAVRWTVDSLGWQGISGGRSARTVTARVLAAAQPGEIVLMHVGSNPDDRSTLDADALPAVIDGLRARGYGFVTLDALLAG